MTDEERLAKQEIRKRSFNTTILLDKEVKVLAQKNILIRALKKEFTKPMGFSEYLRILILEDWNRQKSEIRGEEVEA